MPELVACPSCGCRVLVPEVRIGVRSRCIACGHSFVAGEAPPVPEPNTYPVQPDGVEEPAVPAARVREVGLPRLRHPLCPRCHRPVGWTETDCPHCGHLLDPADARDRGGWQPRRDAVAHRGEWIDRLGGVALACGCVALCAGPPGALPALGCGLVASWMARHDLDGMAAGLIDNEGRWATEHGRKKALAGVALALLSSLLWVFAVFHLFSN